MKKIIAALIYLSLSNNLLYAYHGDSELEIIYDVIKLYQFDVLKKFNKKIKIEIIEDGHKNAYSIYEPLKIIFHRGYLNLLKDTLVLRTICHEVGHFLGDNSIYHFEDSLSAVEGEADFFSGSCMVRYFEEVKKLNKSLAKKRATILTKEQLEIITGEKLIPRLATKEPLAKGNVLRDHPTPNCRLLTVLHGINEMPRPKCWYNP